MAPDGFFLELGRKVMPLARDGHVAVTPSFPSRFSSPSPSFFCSRHVDEPFVYRRPACRTARASTLHTDRGKSSRRRRRRPQHRRHRLRCRHVVPSRARTFCRFVTSSRHAAMFGSGRFADKDDLMTRDAAARALKRLRRVRRVATHDGSRTPERAAHACLMPPFYPRLA